jgi:uncharacterized membrane protein YeaQ/YmgE (transglycosylase-associated protein family)
MPGRLGVASALMAAVWANPIGAVAGQCLAGSLLGRGSRSWAELIGAVLGAPVALALSSCLGYFASNNASLKYHG